MVYLCIKGTTKDSPFVYILILMFLTSHEIDMSRKHLRYSED